MMTLGDRLKQAREANGWSLNDVAPRIKSHFTTISGWERNFRRPNPEKLKELARLYGVTVDWLLGNTDDQPQPEHPDLSPSERLRQEYHAILRGSELPDETAELVILFAEYLDTHPKGDEAEIVRDFMRSMVNRKKK
jgi:transcriptional regulator with XRE-family HTH domain